MPADRVRFVTEPGPKRGASLGEVEVAVCSDVRVKSPNFVEQLPTHEQIRRLSRTSPDEKLLVLGCVHVDEHPYSAVMRHDKSNPTSDYFAGFKSVCTLCASQSGSGMQSGSQNARISP